MPKRRPEGPEAGLRASGRDLRAWTTLARLRALSATSWERGQLLNEALDPSGIYPRRRPLKRPSAPELRSDYAAARAWATELFAAAGPFTLETVEVGRTTIGSNALPAAAVFASVEDEVTFAGKGRELARFLGLVSALTELDPALRSWAARRPLQLLELGEAALTAARVALWLRDNPAPGIYVRQLSLPGVHTKFVEGHRRVIDELVATLTPLPDETALPKEAVLPDDGGTLRTPSSRFALRHGFLHQPEQVRFRLLDPGVSAPGSSVLGSSVLGAARDIMVTAEAFSTLRLPVDTVIVTENLVNFLALPDRPRTLALFGRGYGFSSVREAAWLRGCKVLYWGDLDTNGFRILDQLRSVHPHVASVLMDEATLLEHRDVWGTEPAPVRAALTRLNPEESALYEALGNDSHGPSVRLEQELIRWDWAVERLAALL